MSKATGQSLPPGWAETTLGFIQLDISKGIDPSRTPATLERGTKSLQDSGSLAKGIGSVGTALWSIRGPALRRLGPAGGAGRCAPSRSTSDSARFRAPPLGGARQGISPHGGPPFHVVRAGAPRLVVDSGITPPVERAAFLPTSRRRSFPSIAVGRLPWPGITRTFH